MDKRVDIEDLRALLNRAIWDKAHIEQWSSMIDELEATRAENEALRGQIRDNDNADTAMRQTLCEERDEAERQRDAERARADALAARVEALDVAGQALLDYLRGFEGTITRDDAGYKVLADFATAVYSTPAASLEAHDAKVREPLEKRMAELEDVLRDIEAYDDKPQVWRSKLGGVLAGAFVSAAHTGKADCSCNECLWVHEETAAHDARVRREALEEAWERMGHAPDPHDPGFFVCNHITVDRWYALRAAILGPESQSNEQETK